MTSIQQEAAIFHCALKSATCHLVGFLPNVPSPLSLTVIPSAGCGDFKTEKVRLLKLLIGYVADISVKYIYLFSERWEIISNMLNKVKSEERCPVTPDICLNMIAFLIFTLMFGGMVYIVQSVQILDKIDGRIDSLLYFFGLTLLLMPLFMSYLYQCLPHLSPSSNA